MAEHRWVKVGVAIDETQTRRVRGGVVSISDERPDRRERSVRCDRELERFRCGDNPRRQHHQRKILVGEGNQCGANKRSHCLSGT